MNHSVLKLSHHVFCHKFTCSLMHLHCTDSVDSDCMFVYKGFSTYDKLDKLFNYFQCLTLLYDLQHLFEGVG